MKIKIEKDNLDRVVGYTVSPITDETPGELVEIEDFSTIKLGLTTYSNGIWSEHNEMNDVFKGNEIKFNKQYKIDLLKIKLSETDYKVTKCYEAFMRQLPLPYNIEELTTMRDAWRAEINQLEQELAAL